MTVQPPTSQRGIKWVCNLSIMGREEMAGQTLPSGQETKWLCNPYCLGDT